MNSTPAAIPVRYMQPSFNNRRIMQIKFLNIRHQNSNDQPCIAAHLQGAQKPTHKANLAKELQLPTHGKHLSTQAIKSTL
jgi:hypothetical protein